MADATMTLNLSAKEMAALTKLADDAEMTKTQVMRHALRVYQFIQHRINSGERMHFSGDQQRAIEFVGPGFNPPLPIS